MLYLWDFLSISMHIGRLVTILLILQSFPITADKRWSLTVFPVAEYVATSAAPLTKPRYLKAVSFPTGTRALQPVRAIKEVKTINFF